MVTQQNAVFCAACGYLSVLSFGYMVGFTSPALPQMTSVHEILHNNVDAASWFGSVAMLGAMLGCLLTAWFVDRYGRRTTLLAICVPFFAGCLFIAVGSEVLALCFGRFLIGFASGASSVAAPLYIAETAPKELRGMLGAGVQLSVTIGILLAYLLGLFLTWRSLAVVGAIVPVVALVATIRAPESPRYLVNARRKDDAVTVLVWLRGASAVAENECRDMEKSVDESADRATLCELFTRPEFLLPLLVALGVMVFQQTTGINAVMFYSVSIFQAAGYKDYGGLASVVIGVVQVVMTAVACTLMDNRGRRQMLVVAGFGMAVSSAFLGLYYNLSGNSADAVSTYGWLALASLIGYIMSFSLGWGPVPMLLTAEIFPARARGLAASVAVLFNWALAFLVTRYFALMNSQFGLDGSFWLFSAASFTAVAFVLRFVPETKGRSLEEIENFFSKGAFVRGI